MIHYLDTRLSLVTPCGLTVYQVKKRRERGTRGYKQVTCSDCLKRKGSSKATCGLTEVLKEME